MSCNCQDSRVVFSNNSKYPVAQKNHTCFECKITSVPERSTFTGLGLCWRTARNISLRPNSAYGVRRTGTRSRRFFMKLRAKAAFATESSKIPSGKRYGMAISTRITHWSNGGSQRITSKSMTPTNSHYRSASITSHRPEVVSTSGRLHFYSNILSLKRII
jgi:hypothetical protein